MVASYASERNGRKFYYLLDKNQKNKSSLKRLLQSLPDGVIIYNGSKIVYWNQTMCSLIAELDTKFSAEFTQNASKKARKILFKENVPPFSDNDHNSLRRILKISLKRPLEILSNTTY